MKKIVLATGGFDPLHSGHIAYLREARELGDMLVVGVNTDAWLVRKKGRAFMPAADRVAVIESLQFVNHCILFGDNDDTAVEAINNVKLLYPNDHIIFANGGDRTKDNIPEMCVKDVEFVFGVGGTNKTNSSSWLLDEWKAPKTDRVWGYYRVLHEMPGTKVKELTINPGESLSMQRHEHRAEYWHIAEGKCRVDIIPAIEEQHSWQILQKHDEFAIPCSSWHKLSNPYNKPCKIVEIQYGNYCSEDDITRIDK